MKRKGISLIVLVITIVVIIILAAAVILSLGKNNPVESARQAQKAQDFANMQTELEMYISTKYANTLGEFDKNKFNVDKTTEPSITEVLKSIEGTKYEDTISIVGGKIMQKVNTGVKVEGVNATVTGKAFAYNNPVVPVGFKTVETSAASWNVKNEGIVQGWEQGLVIQDEDGNEFVWIPVKNIDNYTKITKGYTSSNVVYDSIRDRNDFPKGVASEIDQIKKYGGYYIGRFEASLPDEYVNSNSEFKFNNNDNVTGKPQSKLNKIVWNEISYNNALKVAHNAYNTENVKSGILTGTQWDYMIKFINNKYDNDYTGFAQWDVGNYMDYLDFEINQGYYKEWAGETNVNYVDAQYKIADKNNIKKKENIYFILSSGTFGTAMPDGIRKNLYDIAGNLWEYTTEEVKLNKYRIVKRGSCFNYGTSASDPSSREAFLDSEDKYDRFFGFRLVLYVL